MNNKMSFTSRDEGKMVAYKILSNFTKIGDIRILLQSVFVCNLFLFG